MLSIKFPNIIIFGDIILDHKINGHIKRLANEAPIPILLNDNETYSLGGCGNVLANIHSLGCNNIYLFSKISTDIYGDKIETILKDYKNVSSHLLKNNTSTTTIHRYFVDNKLIFRNDLDIYNTITKEDEIDIYNQFIHILSHNKIDSIIFSDYNRGFLSESLCQSIIKEANKLNIFTSVDPRNNYIKYIGCSLIKPNRLEVEKIFGINISFDNLFKTHKHIKKLVESNHVLITLADKGISLYNEDEEIYINNQENIDVIDVTGAGDIVNSIVSYYFPLINDKKYILQIANYIATQSVKHAGTYIIQKEDILLANKYFNNNKIISINDIKFINKFTIVTNGCFDILHKGHLELFKYCKSLNNANNIIIVALNSDDSIRKLKGNTRPINNLDSRIAMLNAINDIDWIVVFNEETPTEILKTINPDILVKGGDYTIEKLPGREYAKDVKLFNYLDGYSTTNIINKINTSF